RQIPSSSRFDAIGGIANSLDDIRIARIASSYRSNEKARHKAGFSMFGRRGERLVLFLLLQSGAEDVAERSAGVGRTVLSDSFLFFGDFERLDRDLQLAGLLVEGDDAGVNLLTDREAFRTLFVAVTRQIRTLDEAFQIVVDE